MAFSTSLQHIVRENEPLAALTWLQIGGSARYYAEPNTVEEVRSLMRESKAMDLPVRILGDGSNILVRDAGCDCLVINLCTAELASIQVVDQAVIAGGGTKLNHVISKSVGAGLAGLEYLAGIPGTLGGAVVGNAAVKNGDIGSRVVRVKTVDNAGNLHDQQRAQLQFGFRRSSLEDVVVVEVELNLEPVDAVELTRRMQSAWIVKRAAQPTLGVKTVQAFIDPDASSIAETLEAADMRGYCEGEVCLSSQFPGFLTVSGHASSDQVIALINKVVTSVEARTGIQLQPQLRIW